MFQGFYGFLPLAGPVIRDPECVPNPSGSRRPIERSAGKSNRPIGITEIRDGAICQEPSIGVQGVSLPVETKGEAVMLGGAEEWFSGLRQTVGRDEQYRLQGGGPGQSNSVSRILGVFAREAIQYPGFVAKGR